MKQLGLIAALAGLLAPLTSAVAEETRSVHACTDRVGAITYHPRPIAGGNCSRVAHDPKPAHSMIYQDSKQQILVEAETSSRAGDSVETGLIVNYVVAKPRDGDAPQHRSLRRQQRFDCRASGGTAVLEERFYEQPLGRGEAVSTSRTPHAATRPVVRGSPDASVWHVLCSSEKSG